MSEIRCASCQETMEPVAHIGVVAICSKCGASLVVEPTGVVRRAVALDTESLMPQDRAALVKARSSLVRPRSR